MIVRVHTSSLKESGNKGSSAKLFDYLNKEDEKKDFFEKTGFFNDDETKISASDSINGIDGNKGRLGKDETKFFMLTINPSEKELKHLVPEGVRTTENMNANQLLEYEEKLQNYTNMVMDNYAKSFDRNILGNDLVYYAKVEHNRYYSGKEAKALKVAQRSKKAGLQSHIHVVVHRYNSEKTKKLSPLSNKQAVSGNTILNNKKVQSGFNHLSFREENEKSFDKMFDYSRSKGEKITHMLEKSEKGFSAQTKDLVLYSDLSPVSAIFKEWKKQDASTIFRNELQNMNPISSFFREQKEGIKEAINYARN